MNIAVCVKEVLDENQVKIGQEGITDIITKIGTFDKNAVEEAVRLRAAYGGSVVVFSFGSKDAKKVIREALAMGADRAVHIIGEQNSYDTLSTSYILAKAIKMQGQFDIVLCSEGSSDIYTGQVAPMLATWLSLPFIGYAKKITIDGGKLKAEQAFEERIEVSETTLPAVISVVSEINEPRYPTLIQIMQASKKPIEEINVEKLISNDAPNSTFKLLSVKQQSMNRKRVIYEGSADETAEKLIDSLIKEGVIRI